MKSLLWTGLAACAGLMATPAGATLVALYKFDDAASIGLDSSGNGNNLIAYGTGATYTAAGASGGGLLLNGSSYLSTANHLAPVGTPLGNSAYTLAVTFKTGIVAREGLIGWGSYGSQNQVNALRTNDSGEGTGLQNYWWVASTFGYGTVADNLFHTAVVNYDGTTRRMYLDGNLIASTATNVNNATGQNFAIGLTNFTEYFTGTLDNVAIFNTAQTPLEVSAATSGAVPEPATWATLVLGFGATGAAMRRRRRDALSRV